MTREEAIQEFQNVKDLIRQDGKDWFDERDLELIDMAIEALRREEAEEKGYCHRIRPKEERREPHGFTADEWYREEFKGEI